jgi:hypothetical protein
LSSSRTTYAPAETRGTILSRHTSPDRTSRNQCARTRCRSAGGACLRNTPCKARCGVRRPAARSARSSQRRGRTGIRRRWTARSERASRLSGTSAARLSPDGRWARWPGWGASGRGGTETRHIFAEMLRSQTRQRSLADELGAVQGRS